jgi:hypothetical protein
MTPVSLDYVFSIGRCLIGCYLGVRDGTHFEFFVAVTPETEMVLSGLCTLTV